MSLKPGIGADAMDEVARVLKTDKSGVFFNDIGDVPTEIRSGKKSMPLGRYLRGKLREKTGKAKEPPIEAIQNFAKQLRIMFEEATERAKKQGKTRHKTLEEERMQKIKNLEVKTEIYESRRNI